MILFYNGNIFFCKIFACISIIKDIVPEKQKNLNSLFQRLFFNLFISS